MHLALCLRILHCMLVCASYYRSRPLFCASRDGISPLGDNNKGSPTYTHLTLMWDLPYRSPGSAAGIFPPRGLASRPRWWNFLHSEAHDPDAAAGIFLSRRPNSTTEISHTRRVKLTGTIDGTIPTRERNKYTKPSMCQVKYPGVKVKHSEEIVNPKQNKW